jgi:methylmalonyl-CoA/ethylmalonyl-CoA epimerase
MTAQSTALDPALHAVRGIDHVGLVVRDLEPVVDFYVQELGMAPDGDRVELAEHGTLVQCLRAGTSKVELLAPTDPAGALARFLEKRGEGLHHVCYEVGDIHAAVRRLRTRDVRMIDPEPWRSPHGWVSYVHPAAAHGCAVELREHY